MVAMDAGPEAPAGRRSLLSTRLVGRDEELVVLGKALQEATLGRGRAAFVVGEAGIGKSRLTQAVAAEAERRGLAVLRGRAVATPTPVAYRPLAEALCSAVRRFGAWEAPELAPFKATLGRLVPEWRVDDRASVDDSGVALAESVLRFFRAVAGTRGCVVVLEDLHWADPETLTIVEYLADNVASERVLCVATVRDEPRALALDLARGLHARRVSDVIELTRLDDGEVAEMVRACLGTDAVAADVVAFAARADGVPFLVEELLAVAAASGALVAERSSWTLSSTVDAVVPLTFADSVRRRLAALGEGPRAVLLAAAVLGRRFDWALLPGISDFDEEAVLGALHAAVETQIISVDGDGFRFRHALSRDAVLAQLLPPERARLSRRALAAIEVAHPGFPDEWCELAAEVADGAGERERAAGLLLEAGRRALERGALATAETTLARARVRAPASAPLAVDLEDCLVEVLSLAGKYDRAVEVGESLLEHLRRDAGSAARRAEAHLRLARAAVAATRWLDADRHLELAAAAAGEVAADDLRARVDAVAAQVAITRDQDRASESARAALAGAERLGLPEVACEALEILGRLARQTDLEAAEAAFRRAHDIAEEHGLTLWRIRALHELGTVDLLDGRGLERLERARDLASNHGALAIAAVVEVQIAAALITRSDPEPSVVVARRAAAVARRYRLHQTLAAALAFEANAHARAGRREAAERCIEEARAVGGHMPDLDVIVGLALTVLAFVEEDRAGARRHVARAAVPLSEAKGDQATGPGAGIWALLVAMDGGGPETSPRWPSVEPTHFLARGFLRYAEAVLAARAGDTASAGAMVAEGDRRLGEWGGWYRHLGHRLLAEAALADGWGDPVGWLREALAFFEQTSAERIAAACRTLLRKAGAPVPRRRGDVAVPVALRTLGVTARELEVLTLLGEGLPNSEIAGRLYLSPRTVERHVANLSVKVGAERRSELVAFAARSLADRPTP
jgi:DNA-binding CsgD family transcriptional regulator